MKVEKSSPLSSPLASSFAGRALSLSLSVSAASKPYIIKDISSLPISQFFICRNFFRKKKLKKKKEYQILKSPYPQIMALPETLDSPQSSSSSDPQLLRNLSSSRLNAQAPEFVPTRSTPQQQQQSMRMMIPPPPPPGIMHVYSPPPAPAGAAFHLPVPMPPHLVPVPHHMSMRNHHHLPYQKHHHREQEVEVVAKKDHQEHKDHGSISSKSGLSEEATLKILNQVTLPFITIICNFFLLFVFL